MVRRTLIRVVAVPQVVAKAELAWQKHAEWQTVSNRVKMIGGNFFKPGESLYSKRIGHSGWHIVHCIHSRLHVRCVYESVDMRSCCA